jgi:hypothetical protein
MIQRWLEAGMSTPHTPITPRRNLLAMSLAPVHPESREVSPPLKHHSYKAINRPYTIRWSDHVLICLIIDVLRVVPYGREAKDAVDSAIDQCAQFFNLRVSIEDAALQAEESTDDQRRRRYIEQGLRTFMRLETSI